MTDVSLFRLYLLRAAYFMMALFLITSMGPGLIRHTTDWPHMSGVARCLLGALGLVAALGVRYPLQMLPVLLFETAWKAIWLLVIGLPLWRSGRLDPDNMDTLKDCLFGVVLMAVVLPWPYLWTNYVKRPSERWRPRETRA